MVCGIIIFFTVAMLVMVGIFLYQMEEAKLAAAEKIAEVADDSTIE